MATGTRTPWANGGGDALSRSFSTTDCELKALVRERKIILTQFNQQNVLPELDALTWRHYIVYWSVVYAVTYAKSDNQNLAEFGVCDGLTAFYAASALATHASENSTFYLYDAWEGMRSDLLTETEKSSAGSYAYLDVKNTQRNLASLVELKPVFNKGYIPEVFDIADNPDALIWFHIDLNSATPTISVLQKFWDRLVVHGVVLFDDFGWPGYEDTQHEIEAWIKDRECNLLRLPTGQALLFKLR